MTQKAAEFQRTPAQHADRITNVALPHSFGRRLGADNGRIYSGTFGAAPTGMGVILRTEPLIAARRSQRYGQGTAFGSPVTNAYQPKAADTTRK
jgi:hypothetical protein